MLRQATRLILIASLLVLGIVAAAQDTTATTTVGLGESEELGSFLVDSEGMTLYSFDRDAIGVSNCYERCAEAWPPLLVESADGLTAAEGIPGTLGTAERTDGTLQVTYNGMPLYYWWEDEAAGDTNGHRVGNVWWVVPPATVSSMRIPELGSSLVGPNGMTLYIFTNDTQGEASACYDNCAVAWPPLLVESAEDIVSGVNLNAELGTIERTDGTLQVTYNGWPLYYWQDDAAIGDATGEGRNDVWWTVPQNTVAVSNSEELGDFLVAPSGMTLYMFSNDTEGVSNCTEGCAEAWPPYTVFEDTRLTAPEGAAGELGTIERENGALQVTYNGMPLYFFQNDAAVGDTAGQGANDGWWVVAP